MSCSMRRASEKEAGCRDARASCVSSDSFSEDEVFAPAMLACEELQIGNAAATSFSSNMHRRTDTMSM